MDINSELISIINDNFNHIEAKDDIITTNITFKDYLNISDILSSREFPIIKSIKSTKVTEDNITTTTETEISEISEFPLLNKYRTYEFTESLKHKAVKVLLSNSKEYNSNKEYKRSIIYLLEYEIKNSIKVIDLILAKYRKEIDTISNNEVLKDIYNSIEKANKCKISNKKQRLIHNIKKVLLSLHYNKEVSGSHEVKVTLSFIEWSLCNRNLFPFIKNEHNFDRLLPDLISNRLNVEYGIKETSDNVYEIISNERDVELLSLCILSLSKVIDVIGSIKSSYNILFNSDNNEVNSYEVNSNEVNSDNNEGNIFSKIDKNYVSYLNVSPENLTTISNNWALIMNSLVVDSNKPFGEYIKQRDVDVIFVLDFLQTQIINSNKENKK